VEGVVARADALRREKADTALRAERRAQLAAVATKVVPVAPAHSRTIPIEGNLASLIPPGGLRRGSTIVVDGPAALALSMPLLAAATATGEWAAVVEIDGFPSDFGALAAAEAGVALDRCAVVRRVPRDRWAVVVNALLEGMVMVSAPIPRHLRAGDAHRLVTRARERRSVLLVHGDGWPAGANLRMHARTSRWQGLERGEGLLQQREILVEVDSQGSTRRSWVGVHGALAS
jgi:hypothetical protein